MRIESGERGGAVLLRLPLPGGRGRGALPLPRGQRGRRGGEVPRGRLPGLRGGAGPDGPAASRRRLLAPRPVGRQRPAPVRRGRPAHGALPGRPQPHPLGRRLTPSERLRDLSRLALFRPEHQELLLASYWGGVPRVPEPLSLLSPGIPVQERLEEVPARLARPGEEAPGPARGARPHPRGAGRCRRSRQDRLGSPLGPAPPARGPARQAAGAHWPTPEPMPRRPPFWPGRCRVSGGGTGSSGKSLHTAPVDFSGIGVAVRPWPEAPETLLVSARRAGRAPRAAAPPPLGRGPRRRGGAWRGTFTPVAWR